MARRKKTPEEEAVELDKQIKKLEAEIARKKTVVTKREEVRALRAELRDLRYNKARVLTKALGKTGRNLMTGITKGYKGLKKWQDAKEPSKWSTGNWDSKASTRKRAKGK